MVESIPGPGAEWVVLLDDGGKPRGRALKSEVHTADTQLHLAFSCWVFDDVGRTLLTRRAMSKRTWPGSWTNTVCGHPAPDEHIASAVRRRAAQELGVELAAVELALPEFRYRAVMTDGTVENEVCPVFTARLAEGTRLAPHPDEVADLRWQDVDDLRDLVAGDPTPYAPWMIDQLALLSPR